MGANGATTTPYTLNGILQFLSVSTSVTLGGSLTVSSTTASTTTSTGALIVSGGAGIAGAVSSGYISVIGTNGAYNVANKFGVDHFGGQARVYSNGPDTSNRGGFDFNCVKSDGTAQITALSISNVGDVSISSTTASTSTTTGALVVGGGVGVGGAGYFGGKVVTSGGADADVSDAAVRLNNNRILTWLDASGGYTNCGFVFHDTSNNLCLGSENATMAKLSKSGSTDDTAMYLYDVTAGSLKRVTRGAADSGGTGYRLLRVAN